MFSNFFFQSIYFYSISLCFTLGLKFILKNSRIKEKVKKEKKVTVPVNHCAKIGIGLWYNWIQYNGINKQLLLKYIYLFIFIFFVVGTLASFCRWCSSIFALVLHNIHTQITYIVIHSHTKTSELTTCINKKKMVNMHLHCVLLLRFATTNECACRCR